MGGVGAVALVGCGDDDQATPTDSASESTASQGGPGQPAGGGGAPAGGAPGGASDVDVADGEIPEETAGPYPGDGSNGVNVLSESGIVRSDLTSSFGSASGVAEGVPVTVKLKVYDLNGSDVTALGGAAVYLWHCTNDGNYSLYSDAVADENFLRGVQETDADGAVHLHHDLPRAATRAAGRTCTSRSTSPSTRPRATRTSCAPPSWRSRRTSCREVYGVADGYDASVSNLDAGQPGQRQRVQRRLLAAAGHGDRARSTRGTPSRLNVPCDRHTGAGAVRPARRRAGAERRQPPGLGAGGAGSAAVRGLRARAVLHGALRLLRLQHLHGRRPRHRDRRARRLPDDVRRRRGRGGPAGPAGAR